MRCLACSAAPSIWAADPPNLSPGPPIVTMLREAVIVATARTPMGRYGGQLKDIRPDDLAAIVLREVCERAHVKPSEVDDVILGCANQAGEDNRNVARMALLLAGFPVEVPGQTVNRLCGSGMQAGIAAARGIQTRAAGGGVAGGGGRKTRGPRDPDRRRGDRCRRWGREHDPRPMGGAQARRRVPARPANDVRHGDRL